MPSEEFHASRGFSVQKERDHKKASNSSKSRRNLSSVLSIGSSMQSHGIRLLSVWVLTLPLRSKRNSSDDHQVTVLLGEHQNNRNAHVAPLIILLSDTGHWHCISERSARRLESLGYLCSRKPGHTWVRSFLPRYPEVILKSL